MSETFVPESQTALYLTTEIVCAYVANTPVPLNQLSDVIRDVHAALSGLTAFPPAAEPVSEPATPAEIRKSIRPDALISFLDGKPYKTLRRHLTIHGLDPERYRARFGLPVDYPMVSASYSARRSELAKEIGLGQRPATQAAE